MRPEGTHRTPGRGTQPPVVGIGASAGGVAALRRFFSQVRPETSAAYAVILHLSPDYESTLASVLQATTHLPVTQVRGRVTIEPNHVYVIPPNANLTVHDGSLVATEVMTREERRAPVDVFFRTLGESHEDNAVCVVLSGTGADGSSGLKRIKECGGLVIAQDPEEAEYADMPRNAIATGLVDYVLPVSDISGRILEYYTQLRETARANPIAGPIETEPDALHDLLSILRAQTGHDFSDYKAATIQRRVERRMALQGLATLADYAAFIRDHPPEAALLVRELLISVTNFFRDPKAWELLEQRVIAPLIQAKRTGDQVRTWVAGCATGEEAYSLAMILAEHAWRSADSPTLHVFATDLDGRAIASAREGFYTDAEVADVSPERLRRFFHREPGGYRVRRELREVVLFAQHNLLSDPPFAHLDLLTCRNLLIYLNRSIQERMLQVFHFALRPGGRLFLGTSESPGVGGSLFAPLGRETQIYESRPASGQRGLALSGIERPPPAGPRSVAQAAAKAVAPIDVHHRLLEQYAPPSIVVTDAHVVVHVSQRAGQFLHVGRGEPSRDVMALVHPGIRTDLRAALHHAARERSTVRVPGVRVTTDQGDKEITLTVKPVFAEDDVTRGFFLILFDDSPAVADGGTPAVLIPRAAAGSRQADDELEQVRGQLSATIEQYELQGEEARASAEELQAANEELRSSAEELETSKEELQSVNEELTTVNEELRLKVDELRLTNNDFQNYINATSIPTIFLDRSLRVKFTTARAQEIFNLMPSDIGRRLSDITTNLTDGSILEDASRVLERLQTVEREVSTRDGRAHLMRILPYRTIDDRIEGIVVTFIDVTSLRQAEAHVLTSDERLRLLIESAVDYAIFTMDDEGRIDSWNPGAQRLFGYGSEEIVGRSVAVLFTAEDRGAGIPDAELVRARAEGRTLDERFHRRKDGTLFFVGGVTIRLGDRPSLGFAKIARDLTSHRLTADALVRAQADLEDRVAQRTLELQQEQARVRGLLARLVTAQEDERARIARDLHDQLGQQLTALRLTLERAQQHSALDDAAQEVDRALALTAALNSEVDFLAWELRPSVLDDLGLAAALPRFVQHWSRHYGIEAEFRIAGFSSRHVSKEREVAYYRIAQEALNNVLKHAHASRVDVVLESRDGVVTLVVADDGVGFDQSDRQASQRGAGLIGMRERAALVGASLDIESTPGEGLTIYLRSEIEHTAPEPAS
jgi:two-component system, chemotaxis family, CheB/CheR fusion protein